MELGFLFKRNSWKIFVKWYFEEIWVIKKGILIILFTTSYFLSHLHTFMESVLHLHLVWMEKVKVSLNLTIINIYVSIFEIQIETCSKGQIVMWDLLPKKIISPKHLAPCWLYYPNSLYIKKRNHCLIKTTTHNLLLLVIKT